MEISRENATTFLLYLDGDDWRLEVLIFNLSQKFLLSKFIHTQNVAYAGDQASMKLSKGKGYVLTWCRVNKLKLGSILDKLVGFDET